MFDKSLHFTSETYMIHHYKKIYHTTVSEFWCLRKPKFIKNFNESYELENSSMDSFMVS
jgi:hypothetical protein